MRFQAGPPVTPPAPPHHAANTAAAPEPGIAELFLAFAAISLSGFGGVLAWAGRLMVWRRRCFTAARVTDAFSNCPFLTAGNMVNSAVILGSGTRGPLGALAAVAGLPRPPMILIIAMGALYAQYGGLPEE